VIGDTPKDITCARAIGARAVAVATGSISREALAACDPDALLDSFADHEAALRAIFP
jgi:phosphoglycolate phosphatase-like HAD superfamily hydrolase